MNAVKFIEERNRMCGTMSEMWGVDAAQIVKNTEEWSAAHPLREYLDTELTPEEIDMDHEAAEQLRQLCRNCDLDRLEKLAEADRDGRVVVLPCQFGEHVFALLDGQKRVRECEVKYAVLDGWLKVFYFAPIDDPGNLYGAPFGAFGQTVFLTPRGGGESIGGDEG